jgi:hypothetical protein
LHISLGRKKVATRDREMASGGGRCECRVWEAG